MNEVTANTYPQNLDSVDTGVLQNIDSNLLEKNMVTPDLNNPEHIKPNKKYVCFADAHKFAKSLNLKTRKEWRLYVKEGMPDKVEKPAHIPAHPDGIYKIKGRQRWKNRRRTADNGLLQAPH